MFHHFKIALSLICTCFLVAACEPSANRVAREAALNEKARNLEILEQELNSRSQELAARERVLDSIQHLNDTTSKFNADLIGNWSTSMRCTETSCEGSAVGDTKSEKWEISYQDNQVKLKAFVNSQLIGEYSGLFSDDGLVVTAKRGPAESTTLITVTLSPPVGNKMSGTRVINQAGKCSIVYALEMQKPDVRSL
jgi:hypothetical protein